MTASARRARADGMKNTSIASSHSGSAATPNWLAAVVSQRSPTMAVRLNSTTSRSPITRGSSGRSLTAPRSPHRRVESRDEPADGAPQRRAAGDVGREMAAGLEPQRPDAGRADVQEDGVAGRVTTVLAPRGRRRASRPPGRGDPLTTTPRDRTGRTAAAGSAGARRRAAARRRPRPRSWRRRPNRSDTPGPGPGLQVESPQPRGRWRGGWEVATRGPTLRRGPRSGYPVV